MRQQHQELPDARRFVDHIGAGEVALFAELEALLPIASAVDSNDRRPPLTETTREWLERLSRKCTVGIISGRGATELQEAIGLDGVVYLEKRGSEFEAVESTLLERGLHRPGVTPVYLIGADGGKSRLQSYPAPGIVIAVGAHPDANRADFGLDDLAAVEGFLGMLTRHMERILGADGWLLRYHEYKPENEATRETLCTLGNGYVATRGAAPEALAGGVHYPGTYIAGLYNKLQSERKGRRVENEDLVNLPNWLPLGLRLDHGDWFHLDEVDILDYEQTLDIKQGLLHRRVRFRDRNGHTSRLEQTRFVHMDDAHLAGLKTTLIAEDWSGLVEIRSMLDGGVENANVAMHAELRKRHLEVLELEETAPNTVFLRVRTLQSRREVAQAARTRVFGPDGPIDAEPNFFSDAQGEVGHHFRVEATRGEPVVVEKIVAIYTSRDVAISEPGFNAKKRIRRAPDFDEAVQNHIRAWSHIWRRFDIGLICAEECTMPANPELVLRLHIFHLVQTASPNTRDLDTGIPARGWHGEAYRGHIFWDELFVFPLLNTRMAEITRALLLYRYRRLGEARVRAEERGCRGALYPWQSGSDGEEQTPSAHFLPDIQQWRPEHTWLQSHISAAVAYNVWQYYQVTNDLEFLDRYGSEIIMEVARFYASLATYNDELDRYEIRAVVGPDEYHVRYPNADSLGIDNNAYTNLMAVWVLCRALEILDFLPRRRVVELCERLQISHAEVERWEEISHKMLVVFMDDGLIRQFEGYEDLEELDREHYRREHGDLQQIAAILDDEDRDINCYKISKQADVLMLFYLFSDDELEQLFARLGYAFDCELVGQHVDYYLERTSHASSLSRVVHSWVEADRGSSHAWELFTRAMMNDVADTQGGTTSEGIHLGAMAGTVDIVERSFIGMEIRGNVLRFRPNRPREVEWLHVNLAYRGHSLAVTLQRDELRITTDESVAPPIEVRVGDECFEMGSLESRRFSLPSLPPSP
ncbi:MAG: glycoside hydrolase family 65 protein [Persicimonas sp.]